MAECLIAAIYARKSTEQTGVAEEAKSVARQIEHARAYATLKGWHVSDDHIYIDDGVSGAEFKRRPGFVRLMNALSPEPLFQVLIMSEESRLGREVIETGYALKQIIQANVRVFYYLDDRERTLDSPIDKMMMSITAFAAELEREKARQRVYDAMVRKARAGHVTGGRVFGYRNRDIKIGAGENAKRSHVEREIDETEAAVIRRIFQLYAAGYGLRGIAKLLNAEGCVAPKPFRSGRSSPGWAPSTIRTVLTREDYRGFITWNRSLKRNRWGEADQRKRPESEWIRTQVPSLQIISDDLWNAVATVRNDTAAKSVRFSNGRLSGRPPKHGVQNPLAGLTRCGLCGGAMVVEVSSRKSGSVPEYRCRNHRYNGTCENALRMNASVINETILAAFEEHALTPEAVSQVVQLLARDETRDRRNMLEGERGEIETRISRLVGAIEAGGDAKALVAKIKDHETRKAAIEGELAALQPIPPVAPAAICSRLAEWRRLLRSSPTQGRAVLQKVLDGRITLTPITPSEGNVAGYRFEAPTRFDKLFSGVVGGFPTFMRGVESDGSMDHLYELRDRDLDEVLGGALQGSEPREIEPRQLVIPVRGFEPRFHG